MEGNSWFLLDVEKLTLGGFSVEKTKSGRYVREGNVHGLSDACATDFESCVSD